MKYIRVLEVKNVNHEFDYANDKLFVIQNQTFTVYDLLKNELIFKDVDGNSADVFVVNKFILYSDICNYKTVIRMVDTLDMHKIIKLCSFGYQAKAFRSTENYFYPVCVMDSVVEHNFLGKVSYNEVNLVERYPYEYLTMGLRILNDNYFIAYTKDILQCRKLDSGNTFWMRTVEDIVKSTSNYFHHNLFCKEGFIYLSASGAAATDLYQLNGQTGETMHKVDNFPGTLCINKSNLYTTNFFDLNVFNFDTKQVSRYDFTEILTKAKLQFSGKETILTQEGLLYFINGKFMFPSNTFGIIDIYRNELVFKHKLKITDRSIGGIMQLRIEGTRILALASDNTLHVFEKK